MNEGSKVIIAAAGPPIRTLPDQVPADLRLPAGFTAPRVCLPGVLAVQGPAYGIEGEGAIASFLSGTGRAGSDQSVSLDCGRG